MFELKVQSQGLGVRQLQQLLNRVITAHPLLKVDGIFGPKTRDRVVMFQKQANLAPDGIVGPKTNGSLVGRALAATIGS